MNLISLPVTFFIGVDFMDFIVFITFMTFPPRAEAAAAGFFILLAAGIYGSALQAKSLPLI